LLLLLLASDADKLELLEVTSGVLLPPDAVTDDLVDALG